MVRVRSRFARASVRPRVRRAGVRALHPDYEPAADALAKALLDVGRVDEAVGTLEQALRRNPGSIYTQESLAWALLQTGRRDEALAQIERAVELTPDDFPMQGSLARMLRDAGRFDEAVAPAREMVRLAPRDHYPRALLADALLAVGDTVGARARPSCSSSRSSRGSTPCAPTRGSRS